jgi:hypothetical protein
MAYAAGRLGADLDAAARLRSGQTMDLDALLAHYFGTADLSGLSAAQLAEGRAALELDFGLEREPGRKFALWVLLEAIGAAPFPAEAFPDHPQLKRAAEDYLSASERLLPDD